MKSCFTSTVACTAAVFFAVIPLHADGGVAQGQGDAKPTFNIRYRLESVDQEGINEAALASTARARLSWMMPSSDGLSAGIEGDYVARIGAEKYNSTSNGRTGFPVVADPTGFDLNQAYVRYRRDSLTVTMGRQRILHAGQRFVGGVAWRQNEQTYDSLRVQSTRERASVDYSYVANVNRIFGPDDGAQPADWEGASHLARGEIELAEGHALGGFLYAMDFANGNGPPNSNRTYGIDYSATRGDFGLSVAIARQSDWADQPATYEAAYYAVEGRLKDGPATYTVGYEVLGSDRGAASFRTPTATLHKFQGWADKFLATPSSGIKDFYLKAATSVGRVALAIALHDFKEAEGGADYGREVDMQVSWRLGQRFGLLFKLAQYDAATHATDTTKAWLVVNFTL